MLACLVQLPGLCKKKGKKNIKESGKKMNLYCVKLAVLFSLAFLLPCAFALEIDTNSVGVYAGGSTSSTSFNETIAISQPTIGEMSSANYKTWLGWIYTIDMTDPVISNLLPANGSTVVDTKAVSFSMSDNWTGIELDKTIVYLQTLKSTAFNYSTDCTASGTGYNCAYTETGIEADGDYNLTVRAVDYHGNQTTATTIFTYSETPPSPTPSGGDSSETDVVISGGGAPPPQPLPEPIPCTTDLECNFGYRCVSGKCAKFFDVKIARVDTPIKAGEVLDFVYILKNPLGKAIDAEVEFWLEKDSKRIVEGREVVFLYPGEEKEFEANLNTLEGMLGKYSLVVQLIFEETKVFATKDIEVKSSVPLALDLYISRLPEKIETGPFEIEIRVGTNLDAKVPVRLNQVIMKDNEIVWKSNEQILVNKSKKIAFEMPILPPGEYKLVMTATSESEGATTSIVRSFTVESRVVEEITINEIVEKKIIRFSIIALLLSIAAILSWHYLVVIRFISPEHPARTRIKFLYFIVFATAFFTLLIFTIWGLSDLLMEFTLNEFYKAMETEIGVTVQQIFADTWNYIASTGIGQRIAEII